MLICRFYSFLNFWWANPHNPLTWVGWAGLEFFRLTTKVSLPVLLFITYNLWSANLDELGWPVLTTLLWWLLGWWWSTTAWLGYVARQRLHNLMNLSFASSLLFFILIFSFCSNSTSYSFSSLFSSYSSYYSPISSSFLSFFSLFFSFFFLSLLLFSLSLLLHYCHIIHDHYCWQQM